MTLLYPRINIQDFISPYEKSAKPQTLTTTLMFKIYLIEVIAFPDHNVSFLICSFLESEIIKSTNFLQLEMGTNERNGLMDLKRQFSAILSHSNHLKIRGFPITVVLKRNWRRRTRIYKSSLIKSRY